MTKNTLIKTVLVAGLVLTPAVIGRYGAPLADLLRADVLIGLGMVATLVALITLEYGRRFATPARAMRALQSGNTATQEAGVVKFPARGRDETRVAA